MNGPGGPGDEWPGWAWGEKGVGMSGGLLGASKGAHLLGVKGLYPLPYFEANALPALPASEV